MKHVLLTIITFLSFSTWAQTLTDIAADQSINFVQSTFDHFGNGMSFYDFNDDGWDDLTFPVNNDSIVFYQNNNGTFSQIGSYVYAIDQVREILWVDYDDDEVLDLCVSYHNLGIRMYKNDGQFNFTDVTATSGLSMTPNLTFGFSFADPDSDGDLDLYVCSYESPENVGSPIPNLFYRNLGNGTFQEEAILNGVDNGLKLTFMSVWFDYNNDDLIDLHVVNDRSSYMDGLYRNLGTGMPYFEDVAIVEGIDNAGHFPMTSSISDFDNDGYQDVFVSDISNGTPQYHYELFRNQNGGNFIDVGPTLNLDTSVYAWGALWVDFNNDGYEDLYVATSFIDAVNNTTAESLLYRNDQGTGFTLWNDSIIGDIVKSSYCPVKGDINNDGFYDIVVLNDDTPPNVLLNSADNGNNYIKIIPVGTVSNSRAIGSKVKIYSGGIQQYQTVFCGSGFCAQNSHQKIFGIGSSTLVDSIEVIFPSGIIVKEYNLQANQNYEIIEHVAVNIDISNGADTLVFCPNDPNDIGELGYYNYMWNTGDTNAIQVVQNTGTYSFEAENLSGDTLFVSNSVFVIVEDPLVYQTVVNNNECGLTNSGSIELIVTQPQNVDSIYWSNGNTSSLNDSLNSGNYSYTIFSINGCEYSGMNTIQDLPLFSVQYLTSPVTDTSFGGIQFYTWGGVSPFTYLLDTTAVGAQIDSLNAGNYQVVVTDSNGCTVAIDFTIMDLSTTSLSELDSGFLNVYYSDQFVWICSDDISQITDVELTNLSGQNVQLDKSWEFISNSCMRLHIDGITGLYQVLIHFKESVQSKTVLIR